MKEELFDIPTDEIIVSERIAILVKGDNFGALGLAIRDNGTTLSSFDVNGLRSSPMYSPLIGIERFRGSLETSLKNGWSIGYFGVPNFG